jgi:hypothetical protein
MVHIDILRGREIKVKDHELSISQSSQEVPNSSYSQTHIYSAQIQQVATVPGISATPRDLKEDQRSEQVLDRAERLIEDSVQVRDTWLRNKVNPMTQKKAHLKNARKDKCQQAARNGFEVK